MSKVVASFNMSSAVRSIRNSIKDRYIESVQTPGVKTEIYTKIYNDMINDVPVDTGALQLSPLTEGGTEYTGEGRVDKAPHYAHGDITDEGIIFNPYSERKRKGTVYYADDVKNFHPAESLQSTFSKPSNLEAVRSVIVREMNKNG